MIFAGLFVILLLLPSYLAVAYYLGLVTARLLGVYDSRPAAQVPRHRLAVVIPAHNEAEQISVAVRSCLEADYPRPLLQVVVVADNCTDATAQIARRAGAECLERTAPDSPGKGPALSWAFEQLLTSQADAIVVLDADCRLELDTLRIADQFLQEGQRVLQANHRVTNADASPISYVAGVGRTLEYDLFFAPKSRLGLAVLLVGTGMVFHRSVLQAFPWTSQSCAEDTEYTIALARRGQSVRFMANAFIRCEGVESLEALRIQRTRWARGNIQAGHRQALALMLSGLLRRQPGLFDLGWTLLLVSRPLVLLHLVCVQIGGVGWYAWDRGPASTMLLGLSAALLPLYAVYVGAGVCAMGLNAIRLRHLLCSPAVVLRLGQIAASAVLGMGRSSWVRTPR
jgi:cellulose synthase/poly-beta-1,6-N-acetylglucosamine synthase-like glycosyltransferase